MQRFAHITFYIYSGPPLRLSILKREVLEVVLLRAVRDGIGTSLIQKLPLAGSGVRFILSPVGSGFPAFARAPFQMEEQLPYHIFQ